MKNKIALGIILVFAIMQLFRIDKKPYQEPDLNDIFEIEEATTELEVLVKTACYDCHSDQVKYPWYSNLAPISWWVQDHIDHGYKHFNFSAWGKYPSDKKAHKADEGVEMLEEEEMPLPSYTLIHRDAVLSKEERKMLMGWFKELEMKYKK